MAKQEAAGEMRGEGGSRKNNHNTWMHMYSTMYGIYLVTLYITTHEHTLLCMDPGGVQTAGIQWSSQSFHQCRVWPRHRNHLDG